MGLLPRQLPPLADHLPWQMTIPTRCYIRGRRIHHGLTGMVLVAIGIGLALHDRRDYPWPLTDPS